MTIWYVLLKWEINLNETGFIYRQLPNERICARLWYLHWEHIEDTCSFVLSYKIIVVSYYNCEKYPLSPLKQRFRALIDQYLPNISDPVYSVHQSFMWFLWLNWCKGHILSRHCSQWLKMLTYCCHQQLWRHNDRLFPRGFYGCFLSKMMLRTVI